MEISRYHKFKSKWGFEWLFRVRTKCVQYLGTKYTNLYATFTEIRGYMYRGNPLLVTSK